MLKKIREVGVILQNRGGSVTFWQNSGEVSVICPFTNESFIMRQRDSRCQILVCTHVKTTNKFYYFYRTIFLLSMIFLISLATQ